jgi:predicted PurR-regulated permease PerM
MQESPVGEASVTGPNPAASRSDNQLFSAAELRLFRYTAVVFSLVTLALTGLVFATVQLLESWLLTPKIMANRSGLHPALVVISLFFWSTALSPIIGMVLAVPLTALFVAMRGEIKTTLKHPLSSREARS